MQNLLGAKVFQRAVEGRCHSSAFPCRGLDVRSMPPKQRRNLARFPQSPAAARSAGPPVALSMSPCPRRFLGKLSCWNSRVSGVRRLTRSHPARQYLCNLFLACTYKSILQVHHSVAQEITQTWGVTRESSGVTRKGFVTGDRLLAAQLYR